MALATQCPHCFTIFRVAGDQLKLRSGLVRCGSCRQVFNGEEFLVEASISDGHYQPSPGSKARFGVTPGSSPSSPTFIPAQAPAPFQATSQIDAIPEVNATVAATDASNIDQPRAEAPLPVPPATAIPVTPEPKVFRSPTSPGYVSLTTAEQPQSAGTEATGTQDVPEVDDEINTATLLRRSSNDDEAPTVSDRDESAEGREPRPNDANDSFSAYGSMDQTAEASERASARNDSEDEQDRKEEWNRDDGEDESEDESGDDEEDEADAPAFVKSAERKERIGHVMKMVMMIVAGILVPVLLLQSVYYWRNQLAVAVPPLSTMLNGMCAAFHCTVGLPAEIERLTLESNELQVVPPNQNIYALTLVLRNRGAGPQAWPHIELTLNNDDEKAVVRRVFRPREYLPATQTVDAGIAGESEQQLKLTFELNDALVSGYRIYLFYP